MGILNKLIENKKQWLSTCSIVWLSSTCLVVSDTGSYLESFEIFKNLFDHFYKYLPQNEYLKIKILLIKVAGYDSFIFKIPLKGAD